MSLFNTAQIYLEFQTSSCKQAKKFGDLK